MCLAVPGKIEIIESGESSDPFSRTGKVSFGGILKRVNLAYVPEAQVGDYVLVHVGFAISVIDEKEALEKMEYLRIIDALS
ncbi:MAG TPA: HypC/HybG/HupF family hydrogenase formation chaperone [Acidobacteriota bacterium]|nr:HypC/HybG/HupF family hydrogenase formation chaperone [Acidobacteriota bacterium]